MMTIFYVEVLLFVVIPKNVPSSAKYPQHFCNFKVYRLTLMRGCSLKLIIVTKFSILDVCGKPLPIVASILILDVLLVFAKFMKQLICTHRFLEKIHRYRERKETTPFP